MSTTRLFHVAGWHRRGAFLVLGLVRAHHRGCNLTFLSAAELYDPANGQFTATGPLAEARTFHQATRLDDGRACVTGGYRAEAPLASAEHYDPATGTFASADAGG